MLFAGLTGSGLYQFNVIVPQVAPGDQKVVVTIQGLRTQHNLFVPVSN